MGDHTRSVRAPVQSAPSEVISAAATSVLCAPFCPGALASVSAGVSRHCQHLVLNVMLSTYPPGTFPKPSKSQASTTQARRASPVFRQFFCSSNEHSRTLPAELHVHMLGAHLGSPSELNTMPPSDLTAMAVMAVLCILSAASRRMGNGVEGRKEERRGEERRGCGGRL